MNNQNTKHSQRWVWQVSVCGQDWETCLCQSQEEAEEALRDYFDFREGEGDVDMSPTFRKLRVKNFREVCPHHGSRIRDNYGAKFCDRCRDEDGETGFLKEWTFAYEKVKEEDFEDNLANPT